jgi:Putative peptidoglycan binding domain
VPNSRAASSAPAINEDILGYDRSLMGAVLAGLGRLGASLWSVTCRRPFDALGVVVAIAGATAILVKALFLQVRPHPAPMLSGTSRPVAATNASAVPAPPSVRASKREPPAEAPPRGRADAMPAPQLPVTVLPPPRPASAPAASAAATAAPPATTATLPPRPAEKSHPAPAAPAPAARPGAPSRRVLAVQRALTDFGYGQVKPTGVMSAETKSAIERFERERKLPVTGQISDRLTRELAATTGRPID